MATALTTGAAGTSGWPSTVTQAFVGVVKTVSIWRQRAETREELVRMDTRMLQDIGITHSDALLEARKSFWQE